MKNNLRTRDNLASVRTAKVCFLLTEEIPSLIPFKGKFPLVHPLHYKAFSEQIMRYDYFDEMPEFLQEIVMNGETISDYDKRFKEYLSNKDISIEEYLQRNPAAKEDVLYDWMFSQQMDIGSLSIHSS
jgi:hypothetical protein